MTQSKDIVQWQTVSGEAVTVGEFTVTSQSQALIIRLPFGGFVWNRPTAVIVERGSSHAVERIPIIDATRLIHWGLIGVGAIVSLVMLAQCAQRKEQAR